MEKREQFACEECGWLFPEELLENYLSGNSIYCEKCGKENFKEIIQGKPRRASRTPHTFKKAFTKVKKKSVVFKDKVKQRIKELRDKYDKD